MAGSKRRGQWSAKLGCAVLVLALQATMAMQPAQAQPAGAAAAGDDASTTVRLIQLLIRNGVLTHTQADSLLRQARQEAQAGGPNHAARKPAVATAAGGTPAAAAVPPGTVRVTYVPQMVRDQIASEVKQQVMQEAQEQGWAEPNQLPDWVQHIKVFGDLRIRGEEDMLPGSNCACFPDFNTINSSSNGFDPTSGLPPPILNTTEDRTRFRVRARIGADAQLTDWAMTEIRLGTGNDRSPVSENQTLGAGGDFSKYSIWLDRAFIRLKPTSWLTLYAGRAPNPFWTTSLLFNDDLNFDGFALQAHHAITQRVGLFMATGIFPVFNTAFNFGSAQDNSTASHDAYLAAIQGGAEWKINDDYTAKGAIGYFDFMNVQGSTSAPCLTPTGFGSCNTDDEIPGWVQFGNTMFPLRNIVATSSTQTTPTPEFYGLASKFDILDVHGTFTLHNFHPIDIVLSGDFVDNLGFNRNAVIGRGPTNNVNSTTGHWSGGNTGYFVQMTFGMPKLEHMWDWNLAIGYRYIETDAVLDALNDSDFHLGGTNAKGYSLVGNLALARNLWVDGKYFAATQVSGPPYTANVLLVDLNARF